LALCSFNIAVSCSHELALQVVNITLAIEQVLFILALDLDSLESSALKIFRVVNIDYVVIVFIFNLNVAGRIFDAFILNVWLLLIAVHRNYHV
jgi:hypothetical protein